MLLPKDAMSLDYLRAMESTRQKKVSKLILRDLATYFQQNGDLYAKGSMLTVTVVRVSPDLGTARVYLSVFGKHEPQEAVDNVNEKTWEVRKSLAAKVRHQLRIVPNLRFYVDDSLDEVEKIGDLLKNG
ncbi:MAG: ribosome-binding factor A [Granulosicoccus sp.]|jgi:ribosome-binding factor A